MSENENIIAKIKEIIKIKIRPILVMDGGNIEFLSYNNGVVLVKLLGSCNGCPLAGITLKNTVEGIFKKEISEDLVVQSFECGDSKEE